MKTNKKAFVLDKKGAAALITAALLAVALLFTGCPGVTGGGSVEGVWRAVSVKENNEAPQQFPSLHTIPENYTEQPYACFSGGKAYLANKREGRANPNDNGLFKSTPGEANYTFANGILKVEVGGGMIFIPNGNTAAMIVSGGPGTLTTTFERVNSPTVEEIKAAKP